MSHEQASHGGADFMDTARDNLVNIVGRAGENLQHTMQESVLDTGYSLLRMLTFSGGSGMSLKNMKIGNPWTIFKNFWTNWWPEGSPNKETAHDTHHGAAAHSH